ncbi:NAD(P)/FAD-dependent oxidoreductase [Neptuniibacter halophilus]|uniref:NAD(P)/FAD-dependent oxidoreductase n=1 Tax=Neptuniibacter halophilus TaxID=651666 RepID=UPI002573B51C|nr:FAD-dependent oxidoreductase [Neptuniibacter halophilus]
MNVSAIREKKIAVVGSGISGLSCAWLLNKAHKVTLFEKDDRLGGHSNTVEFERQGERIAVDTGFIVYNPVNYPNLVAFFSELGVETCDTDMSFSVSINQGNLEYSGTGIPGLLAQKRNLLRPRFWQMLLQLKRFYAESAELMQEPQQLRGLTLGDLLQQKNYSDPFIYDHLLPMGAAIWSTPVSGMLEYPAESFLRFCQNHGLVQFKDRPQWRTVVGGSRQYVKRIADELQGRVSLNRRIHKIYRQPNAVIIEDHHGQRETFDEVVLACHADQALRLLDSPSVEEQQLLRHFPYQRNLAYLHQDSALMPERQAVWSSWNYLSEGWRDASQQVSVSYWMNRLQPLNTEQPLFVSLNPLREPKPGSIIRTFHYDHPQFGRNSLDAQQQLWSLQGQQNTWFCGAYFGYGFHEDGLQAGLAVAEQLGGIPRPWTLEDKHSRIHVTPVRHHPQPIREASSQ